MEGDTDGVIILLHISKTINTADVQEKDNKTNRSTCWAFDFPQRYICDLHLPNALSSSPSRSPTYIPGIPAAFGAYFVLFVLLVDDDHHEHASTAKISSEEASAAKSSSEEASAAKISATAKKVLKRKAVVMGKVQDLEKILQENEIPVLDQVTFQGNTILHLAAIYGHDHLVRRILDHELNVLRSWNPNIVGNFAPSFSHYQTLLVRQNSEGNLALHVAAAAGHELIVDYLVESLRRLPQDRNIVVRSEQILVGNIFSVSNNDGFTALHLALKGNHVAVSLQLVREDQSTCFLLDKEGVSPLYMAAEAGHVSLVEHMLHGLNASFVGKSVVCAALKSKDLDVLRAILESDSDLVDSRDEYGRTPLAFAASIGYDIGVEHMLTRFGSSTQIAYIKSEDGSFPIHSACAASRKTRNAALKVILKHHPDTIEMLNSQGQNVLHVAAENGNAGAVGYLLRKADVKRLINEQDLEGNTPLHLASINSHPKVVSLFIHDSRVELKVLNHKGFTTLDAAEEYMAAIPSLQQMIGPSPDISWKWLIWVALVSAGTTRAPRVHLKADSPTTEEDFTLKMYKDRVNTLLVVATLVATMAFAAGLSVPLGYNSTEFKSNVKHSYKESAFNAFVICNSIAVYSAVISTVALIGTQLADMKCMLTTFKFIVPLLGFSIISMSLAFVAGLYLVLGQHHWLAVFVLASGGFYLMALLLLIIPYASPYTFSPLVFRYFLRFPFSMLVFFVYWRDGTDGECSSRVFRWSFIG
ncbi:BnaC09g00730D [Brassica napus]|uniref:BnaC09g00730D protein n=1 Tax=Brassica napus TaxID=3708 RepID=A0A078GAD4_BRANA|nr:BnaC09g00730D [Brassica napus]